MQAERLFTIEEANEMIPKLEAVMEQLQRHGFALREQLKEVAHSTDEPLDRITTAQLLERRPQLRPVIAEIDRLVSEIEACGGDLKGLDLGLVDFPAERDGEIILLCWQYGEKEITHYHTFEGGFTGRQPLDPRTVRAKYLQ